LKIGFAGIILVLFETTYMKQLLIAALIFLSFNSSAQIKEKLFTKNLSDVQLIIDNLLSSTVNKYILIEDTTTRSGISKIYDSDGKELKFSFYVHKEGGNYDLGKADTTYYRLGYVFGSYKDLFSFWKNNFQPDAELEKIAETGHAEVQVIPLEKGKLVLAFAKSGKVWQIIVNRY
jgi:hypothetical protein